MKHCYLIPSIVAMGTQGSNDELLRGFGGLLGRQQHHLYLQDTLQIGPFSQGLMHPVGPSPSGGPGSATQVIHCYLIPSIVAMGTHGGNGGLLRGFGGLLGRQQHHLQLQWQDTLRIGPFSQGLKHPVGPSDGPGSATR